MSLSNLNLEELSADNFEHITQNTVMELEITKIYPNKYQPRKLFDELKLQELADSILKHGLLEPIVVVKNGHKYMIIAGERRWRASLLAELPTIKASIISADEKAIRELALIENIQRDDLTQFEIAKYIRTLWDSGDYAKKKDLADTIGKRDTYISKALSVSHLDANIIEDIETNKLNISISVLDEISRSGDNEMQIMVYKLYKAGDIKRDDIKKLKAKVDDAEEAYYKNIEKHSNELNDFINESAKNSKIANADDESEDILTKKMDFQEDIWEPVEENKQFYSYNFDFYFDSKFKDLIYELNHVWIFESFKDDEYCSFNIKEIFKHTGVRATDTNSVGFSIKVTKETIDAFKKMTSPWSNIELVIDKPYLIEITNKSHTSKILDNKETFTGESETVKDTYFSWGITKFIVGQSNGQLHTALLCNKEENIPNIQVVIDSSKQFDNLKNMLSSNKKYRLEIKEHTEINTELYNESIIENMVTDFQMAAAKGTRKGYEVVNIETKEVILKLNNAYEIALFDALWDNDLVTGDLDTQEEEIDELNSKISDLEDEIEKLKEPKQQNENDLIFTDITYDTLSCFMSPFSMIMIENGDLDEDTNKQISAHFHQRKNKKFKIAIQEEEL